MFVDPFSSGIFARLILMCYYFPVEYLLNETSIKVIVYSGVLDFLVSTAGMYSVSDNNTESVHISSLNTCIVSITLGTRQWLDNLNWSHKEIWHATHQTSLVVNAVSEGYMKRVENLMLYVIFRAGHSVIAVFCTECTAHFKNF